MELPRRSDDDRLLPPGEAADIRRRLRTKAAGHDLVSVALCAFDHRTRMLPFIYADLRMAPAGIRAIGSALADSGSLSIACPVSTRARTWSSHWAWVRPGVGVISGSEVLEVIGRW